MPTDLNPYAASMIDFSQYDASMQKAIDALQVRYARMRASGASPRMLDGKITAKQIHE